MPSQWTDPSTSNQWVWDLGMVVIPDYLGYQTGWMGYGALVGGVLNGLTHLNAAIRAAVPNYSGEPASCQQAVSLATPTSANWATTRINSRTAGTGGSVFLARRSRGTAAAIYHYRYDPHLGKTVSGRDHGRLD